MYGCISRICKYTWQNIITNLKEPVVSALFDCVKTGGNYMLKKIKIYFLRKKEEELMKRAILESVFITTNLARELIMSKEPVIKFATHLIENIDYDNFQVDLVKKMAEYAHEKANEESTKD